MTRLAKRRLMRFFIAAASAAFFSTPIFAADYALPGEGNSLIGQVHIIPTASGDTVTSLAQRYNLGVNAIADANPDIDPRYIFQNGTYIKVPAQFILPPMARKGIIINLPEMRLYYYPEGSDGVMTFPIGIGKIGKTIPVANTSIIRKKINPTWTPTPAIREFNMQQGIDLPASMGPGPDNPLGPYAIYTGIPTYLIHSTIFPESIGRRASFGCIRMNETDIKQFFPLVDAGIPIAIIDMPYKVGWEGNQLYLEAHPPLEERGSDGLPGIAQQIAHATAGSSDVTLIDWQAVSYLAEQPDGVPHEIGFRVGE